MEATLGKAHARYAVSVMSRGRLIFSKLIPNPVVSVVIPLPDNLVVSRGVLVAVQRQSSRLRRPSTRVLSQWAAAAPRSCRATRVRMRAR